MNAVSNQVKNSTTNLMYACESFYDKIGMYPLPFNYNEDENVFISEPFQFEEVPEEEFFLMVKPVGSLGIVYVAQEMEMDKLDIVEQLGLLSYIKNRWI